ncbi:hypothetical protein EW146_g2580 [Bondarzewia mesenterica]|uniref:J domain-containing protein n=1 Tax=Bondarzewia mesenterica TaxID=1095465 RepID=A0A4S4M2H7_9AGAM|nr:hypothetical protein EW146_g2580 [Bondarzewia mesenterica]
MESHAVSKDSRVGPKFFRASVGFGGSYFQKDIFTLVYLSESLHLHEVTAYWREVVIMNEYRKRWFSRTVVDMLFNTITGKRIAVLGFAFKTDAGDTSESLAISLIRDFFSGENLAEAIPDILIEKIKEQVTLALTEASHCSSSLSISPQHCPLTRAHTICLAFVPLRFSVPLPNNVSRPIAPLWINKQPCSSSRLGAPPIISPSDFPAAEDAADSSPSSSSSGETGHVPIVTVSSSVSGAMTANHSGALHATWASTLSIHTAPFNMIPPLLSLAIWSYMLDVITNIILRFVRPYLGSKTVWHYRLVFSLVLFLYIIRNLVEAMTSTPPSYYQLLDVPPNVDGQGLKLAFRRFAKRSHPDRVGDSGTAFFVEVREGYETLMDPVKRWAYDRFGPKVLQCIHCKTPDDFLEEGLVSMMGFHTFSAMGLIFFSVIGKTNGVSYWRYLLYFALAATDLALVFSPSPSDVTFNNYGRHILTYLFPSLVSFQYIRFLHQAFLYISFGVTRIAPVLIPGIVPPKLNSTVTANTIVNLSEKVKSIDKEPFAHSSIHHALDQAPLPIFFFRRTASHGSGAFGAQPDEQTIDLLTREMENMMVEERLRKEGGLIASERDRAVRSGRLSGIKPPPRKRAAYSNTAYHSATSRSGVVEVIDVDAEEVSLVSPAMGGLSAPSVNVRHGASGERLNQMWFPRGTMAASEYVHERSYRY